MPKSMEVPCEDCDERKREIEEDGMWEVLGCHPIEGKGGWCLIEYQLKG